jgi:hypothetical protein
MNLGVVGSRGFNDRELMFEILDVIEPFVLISGGAVGADSLAEEYANLHQYGKIIHLPDWHTHGKSAGFIRNKSIVEDSDLVLAFWDGISNGTKSTIALCRKLGVPVEIIFYLPLKV